MLPGRRVDSGDALMLKFAKTIREQYDPTQYVRPLPARINPTCQVCEKRPQADGCGIRCESCWAEAAQRWVWDGTRINTFRIVKKR